jgi:tetratricopeptide (TPR) repeat protein
MLFSPAVIGLFWVWASADLSTLTDETILEQAETAFREGVSARGKPDEAKFFRKASEYYEELRQRGADNSDLYRNQGNAALLAGGLAEAILAYRRGLRLDPNDRELRESLAYARDQVVYSPTDHFGRPDIDPLPPWLPRWTPGILLLFIFFFYSFACLGVTRWRMTLQKLPLQLAIGALGAGVLFGIGLFVQLKGIREDAKYHLVVIVQDGTYLRKGNHSSYPRSYGIPLNQGVEARLLYVRANWLQIQLAGYEVGWVPREAVLVDTP